MRAARHDPLRRYLEVDARVATALAQCEPVVALESSVVAAGLPYPQNLDAARASEAAVRAEGACPATIGLIGGRIKVGLAPAELEMFARADDVPKASRRDIPYLLATGQHGATTVAATLIAARLAGIAVFATGGIGGVHRLWQDTLDVSADLEELARTNVAVVCAGAKAILDLPATLEYLETRGVPVLGYGTDEFPAFYTRESGLRLDQRVDTPEAAAAVIHAKWALGLEGGIVIANPIPASVAMERSALEGHIEAALEAARGQGIAGKDLTPFLLDRIAESSGGASLRANLALLENNAHIAARIARAYAASSAERAPHAAPSTGG
ncbi:MAG: pseudouridine-5'-phosphate glycosidase [Alphaproteobacteria bacterium]